MKIMICRLILMVLFTMSISYAEELKLCGVEWPPFTYSENEQIVKGISFEISTEAFRRMNVSFTARELPWPRCLEYVKDGDYDAVIDNAALAQFLYGTHPTAIYPLAIYVRHDFPQDTFSWEAMKGKTVGMVRGYDYTEAIRQFDGWEQDLTTTDEMMLMKLKGNRYDYAILDIFAAPILAEQVGIQIKMLTPLLDTTNLYLVFNQDRADMAKRYDTVIGDMIHDGTMDRIYQHYLPYSYADIMKMKGE